MKNLKKIFFLVVIIMVVGPLSVFAQEGPVVYFSEENLSFSPESEFTVEVLVSSRESINAFDIEVVYPAQSLEVASINRSNSIIDFWRQEPGVLEDGVIGIQGGTPTAFSGTGGQIVKINFRAIGEGVGEIAFRKAQLYYADGEGTRAQTSVHNLTFSVSAEGKRLFASKTQDANAPVFSSVEVIDDPLGQTKLLSFLLKDDVSGIKEVSARTKKWLSWGDWISVANPTPLPSGTWKAQLQGQDNEGNISIKTVYMREEIVRKVFYLVGALFVLFVGYFLKIREKKWYNKKK